METKENEIRALISSGKLISLDVRASLAGGVDPFKIIIDKLKTVPDGFVLEVVNSFEPKPLINILNNKGWASLVISTPPEIKTYFLKVAEETEVVEKKVVNYVTQKELEYEKLKFENNCIEIDVRDLEMPMPMVTILEQLETLKNNEALFVHHKKVPQMLLPELEQRGFNTWIADIKEGKVELLITK